MKLMITFLCSVLLFGVTGCGPAHKTKRPDSDQINKIRTLAVVVEQEKEFEVVHSRATADATGAVLFGLAGATIGASIDQAEDRERAESLASAVHDLSCHTLFSDALSTLQKNDRFDKVQIIEVLDSEQLNNYDAVVTFTIEQWGLRLVDQKADLVSGFMEIDMKMRTVADSKLVWDERHVIAGHGREYFRKYVSDSELLKSEMKQTITEAGTHLSNLLIYQ